MQFKMSTTATTQQQKAISMSHGESKLNKLSRRQLALAEVEEAQEVEAAAQAKNL